MPVTESELLASWRSMAVGTDAMEGWRSIALSEQGSCRTRAACHSPGNEEALLVSFHGTRLPPINQLPQGRGFNVHKVVLQGSSWLALTRRSEGRPELFTRMVADVLATLDQSRSSDTAKLLQIYLSRIRAWQDFMRKGQEGLSPEEELGLAGELILLNSLIDEGLSTSMVLAAWKGPFDGLHDFELGTGAVEVKTTLAAEHFPATIGSLEQLDDSLRHPLFLGGIRLEVNDAGSSLPQLIAHLRVVLQMDPEAAGHFETSLLHAGYLDRYLDNHTRRFSLLELLVWRVDENFPRLVPFNVPAGVSGARYDIRIESKQTGRVSLHRALKELGVL